MHHLIQQIRGSPSEYGLSSVIENVAGWYSTHCPQPAETLQLQSCQEKQ